MNAFKKSGNGPQDIAADLANHQSLSKQNGANAATNNYKAFQFSKRSGVAPMSKGTSNSQPSQMYYQNHAMLQP